MSAPASPTDPKTTFNCAKWADCSCGDSGSKCGCGDDCGCGSVSVASVSSAMSTLCPFADCSCGMGCGCGKDCTCGGTKEKSAAEWVETVKAAAGGCKCVKVDGKCPCGETCQCQ